MTDERTETLVADGDVASMRNLLLRVVTGPARGRTVPLGRGRVIVGAAADVDLVLADPRVSRRHAEFFVDDDGVRVKDLGSKNGTLVDGVRVDSAWLRVGARVGVGDSELRVDAIDEPAPLSERARFAGLSSKSPAMMRLFDLLARAAGSDVTVLLQGPTGTGKDVLARALHAESPRRAGPFCVVDCGSLAPSLVQSELFGHKRGAFTGADVDRAGVFEAARGGTVFLDEIGELPLDLQPALLRVLENREVKRLGESAARPVDVRVVAATHRDLQARVSESRFREDLYFRLAVVRARVPALAERRDDIALLTTAILADLGYGGALPSGALRKLQARAWPGNVRELKNALQAAVALASGGPLRLDEVLPTETAVDAPGALAAGRLRDDRERNERQFLETLLHKHEGNVSAAAREAGIDRKHLHRLIARHEIDVDRFRPT